MRVIDRFQAIMAAVFFVAASAAAWRAAVADGGDIWYVPLVLAVASALMTLGALRHRKKKRVQNED